MRARLVPAARKDCRAQSAAVPAEGAAAFAAAVVSAPGTRLWTLMPKPGSLFHLAYLVTIAVKGFDGALELLLGLLISLAGPQRFYFWVLRFTAPELDRPHGRLVEAIRHGASGIASGQNNFAIVYLLVHGVLKLGLALVLLRGGGRWIFPVGTLILTGFIAYMSWHLSERWSGWLLAFALFDFVTLLLVLNEWRQPVRKRA